MTGFGLLLNSCRMIAAFSKSVLAAFILSTLCAVAAAETPVVRALQEAHQARRSVWGEARVGEAAKVSEDERARGIGQKLKSALPGGGFALKAVNDDRLLRQNVRGDVEVHLRAINGTVAQLRGVRLQRQNGGKTAVENAEETAAAFLRQYRDVLGIVDPDQELKTGSHRIDTTGERHLPYAQTYKHIPVWPSGLTVHLDAGGNVALLDGAYAPTPTGVATEPLLTAAEAERRAKESTAVMALTDDTTLVVYSPLDRAPRLAWRINVTLGFSQAWRVVVDALDGAILSRETKICEVNAAGSGKDLGGASQNFNVWSAAGKFYLADTGKKMYSPAFDAVKDPHGVISILDARNVTTKNLQTVYLIESTSANDWLPDGVSAMINFGLTYDYFLERFDRNSLDGAGGNIQAAVRVAEMDNAFWNGNLKMMFFGNVRPYPSALDVVGHELTHGLTQNSADLIYELQPGALNESFSDILGEMVALRAVGSTTWKLGESLGKVFRDFKNPGSLQIGGLNRPYPSKMSEFLDLPNNDDNDHGGVHLNSSIINHCFYQLAEGLPGAIGTRDAEKIFYRCLTTHLQKQSQFIDARLGCVAAAEALFGAGSTQARKTAEAFDFVEIFDKPPTPEPSPIPVVPGADSTLLVTADFFTGDLLLGRREDALGDPVDGVLMAESVKLERPSVAGDGSAAVYVNGTSDICVVPTDDPFQRECLGLDGLIHSVAISPDGKLAAFVVNDPTTGQVDNQISVYEFATDKSRTYQLVAPVLDSSPVDNVLYADALIFSSDSKQLIYDAVSQIHFGGGDAVTRWSIFSINLATDSTSVLVPPLELADFGNPNLGRAGTRYLTFDARETATGQGHVITMDLFTGEVAQVGNPGHGFGYPCFNGDESAIIFAQEDPTAISTGRSLVKQALAPTRLAAAGQPSLWFSDATVGVIYRRGDFVGGNHGPTITMTSPLADSNFNAGAPITISADAADADGSIVRVEFFDGSDKLGEDTTAPYSFVWNNAPVGAHRLIARAQDNLGAATDSAAIPITVGATNPASTTLSVSILRGALQIRLQGSAGNYAIEQSNDLKSWTEKLPATITTSGAAIVEDTIAPGKSFYRARAK